MNEVLYTPTTLVSLPGSTLVTVAIVFTVLHFGLLACIIFFRKQLHPMYYLLLVFGSMLQISPFYDVNCSHTGRWLRLYVVAITAVVGLILYRPKRLGLPAKLALIFAVFMMFNSIRRNASVISIVYRALLVLCLFDGIAIAHCLRDQVKVFKQLRFFIAMMTVYSAFMVYYIACFYHGGRLLYGRIGPMDAGSSAGCALIICLYIAAWGSSRKWKPLAIFSCIVLGLFMLLTGSRGPTLSTICGCLCLVLPLSKRPGQMFMLLLLVAIGLSVVLYIGVDADHFMMRAVGISVTREGARDITTGRLEIWYNVLAGFRQNPIIGCGSVNTSGVYQSSAHSAYVQIISEHGLVGTFFFLLFASVLGYCLFFVLSRAKKIPEIGSLRYFALACIVFPAIYGIAQSTILYGTKFPTLLLALGIGYFDWMYLAVKKPRVATETILVKKRSCMQTPMHPSS